MSVPVTKVTPVILIADDSAADRNMIRRGFLKQKIDCQLKEVEDGEQALAYLRAEGKFEDRQTYPEPHLLLLDINMPKMNGKETLTAIRADDALKTLPVVMLTTSRDQQDVFDSYLIGVNDYFVKPANASEYLSIVASLEAYWLERVTLSPE